ncbi:hypothetical protein FJZ19_04940 [Candidatus Pacearchaeota archaeon]|nr:hypothetical protein [Candidatus Pacearchaeota archaeon]
MKKQKISEVKELKIVKTETKSSRIMMFVLIFALVAGIISYIIKRDYIISLGFFFFIIIIFPVYRYFSKKLSDSGRIRRIEEVFPDFLQLMSSNLRAGITIDKAMLLSARPEFSPLDAEIQKTGKDIVTGKDIEVALIDMSKRINSEKIHKTILLIISGIKAGGNLAVLLEETAVNMRERNFVEKRAASNVLMYAIFIFVAVAIGAPALFSLSTILVGVLTKLLSGLPTISASTTINMPFTLSKINISVAFIEYFSIVFIIAIDILASLILGLVMKGEEKEGLKYTIPLIIASIAVFFVMKILLGNFMAGMF